MSRENEVVKKLGSEGGCVRRIQDMLSILGYYLGRPDGQYGPMTVRAVRQFQIVHGLEVNGEVDSATRDALERRFGDRPRDVVAETPPLGEPVVDEIKVKLRAGAFRPRKLKVE